MPPSSESPKSAASGFEGEITGLGLSDIIQLNLQNRFSGCIDVHYEERHGLIFMKDGEIVHAEQGSTVGEPAFYEMLSWPAGRFSLQENVATTRSTIRRSCNFLILEAHRLIDERRAARGAQPTPAAPRAAAKPAVGSLMEKLRQIPGVTYAILQGKDGARVGDDSYEAEVLAGQALYLAMVGQRLGAQLQAGEMLSAAVQGTARHLLLFVTKNHFLTVLVDAQTQVGAVEAEVRKMLASAR